MPDSIADSTFTPERARSTYDFLSSIYEYLTTYEGGAKRRGLELAGIAPGSTVLEVGFGTGASLREIAQKSGEKTFVIGIDISTKMLRRTFASLGRACLSDHVSLMAAEASHLPFEGYSFDIVFSSYVLDLMPVSGIAKTLRELHRVLKPGGHAVFVGLSKGNKWYSNMKAYETFYRLSPSLLGGCRPLLLDRYVQDAGFANVEREFLMAGGLMPSEIIRCEKPL